MTITHLYLATQVTRVTVAAEEWKSGRKRMTSTQRSLTSRSQKMMPLVPVEGKREATMVSEAATLPMGMETGTRVRL